jgi:hypothetical protein
MAICQWVSSSNDSSTLAYFQFDFQVEGIFAVLVEWRATGIRRATNLNVTGITLRLATTGTLGP